MILKIINKDRFVGVQFWNGIFKCLRVDETDTNYRFQFSDSEQPHTYHWIEVSRIGHWNHIDNKWFYSLNYRGCNGHQVSADWFEDYKNAMDTFGEALKQILKL